MNTTTIKRHRFSIIRMFTVFALTLVTLIGSSMPALASQNTCEYRSGSSNSATTFTVETKGWIFGGSIKLQQSKGVAVVNSFTKSGKETKMYGCFTVIYSYTDSKGKVHSASKKFTGKTCTINLKKNQTYTITVKPERIFGTLRTIKSWKQPAYWSAVKTRNVTSC